MMNIQQKRDLLMSLPLMEQEQRWNTRKTHE